MNECTSPSAGVAVGAVHSFQHDRINICGMCDARTYTMLEPRGREDIAAGLTWLRLDGRLRKSTEQHNVTITFVLHFFPFWGVYM